MAVLLHYRTWIASLIVGSIAHWVAVHPGVIDPFYTGTLIGVILHALHVEPGSSSAAPPRVGGSV